jgi:Glycosyl hydrolase family 12
MSSTSIKSIALSLLVLCLAACGGGGGGSGGATSNHICNKLLYTVQGKYAGGPNIWGLDSATNTSSNYTDCITLNSSGNTASGVLEWDFQSIVGNPAIAYPSFYYGAKPRQPNTDSTILPRLTSQINSFVVSWDYSLAHGGGLDSGNVLIDNWLTSIPNPTGYDPQHGLAVELMVFLDTWGSQWATYYLGWNIVTINGIQYYFQGYSEKDGTSTYDSNYVYRVSLFPVVNMGVHASLDLAPIIDYLTSNSYIPSNLYFANTEFGHEIKQGSGKTIINSYGVSVN